jgi:hypothetical protein
VERELEGRVQPAGVAPLGIGNLFPRPLPQIRVEPLGRQAAPGDAVVVGQVDL